MGKIPQIRKLEGVIQSLARELEQLAPQPDLLSSFSGLSGLFNGTKNAPRRLGLKRRIAACRRRIASLQNDHRAETCVLAVA